MNWTTEYPTKPGFYWIRNWTIADTEYSSRVGSGPDIVEMDDDLDHFSWTGDVLGAMRNQVVSAEWQGPIEPEVEGRCAPAVYNFETLNLACRDCNKAGRSFVSWPLDTVNGNPVYGIICRNCWIKRLTPEQRKVYMV